MSNANYVFNIGDVVDGSESAQALVTIWESGNASIAFRENPWATWGRPVTVEPADAVRAIPQPTDNPLLQ